MQISDGNYWQLSLAELSSFACIFALFNNHSPQVQWELHRTLLTVWPIPSTCMVALCTRSKPWPVTVIVLPPLWHTHAHAPPHTHTHTESNPSHDKRMSNLLWYANTVGYCAKTTGKQVSHMSSKKNTRNPPHTFCAINTTIVRKRCTSGGHYCEGFCQWCQHEARSSSMNGSVFMLVVRSYLR